jgi:serine/threonine protein kinase
MPQTGSEREARADLLLGKLALERGLITHNQLRDALAEQSLGVSRGRKLPRPLGVILASRKQLSDVQVAALQKDIEALYARLKEEVKGDAFLGQILVDADLVAPRHLEECLVAQAELIETGVARAPRLGELLVERGFAMKADIDQALALQKAMVRLCTKCGASSSLSSGDGDRCPSCQGPLEAQIQPSSLSLSGPLPLPPEEPRPAGAPEKLGKYLFLKPLGRGGCGVVYEAMDTELHRVVAVKLMHRDPGEGGESNSEVERFIREARLAAKLSHPNIVRVYEAGILDGQHYIAMERIEGASMARWRRSGSITIRQQIRVLRDAALAVQAAHGLGITHRDLKPDNVLVDLKNKAYVMDFGLAKKAGGDMSGSMTAEGHILGTPAYMSPEQAKGKKTVSKLSDVWSMGIMLYEILAGKTPFRGETPIATLVKILKDPIPPLASVAPGVMTGPLYKPLEAVCLRALQREPGQRYPSAKAFADDLTKWLKGDDVRVTAPRRSLKPATLGWTAVGVAVVLSIGMLLMMPDGSTRWAKQLKQADDLIGEGRWEDAREILRRVVDSDPNSLEAHQKLRRVGDELEGRSKADSSGPDLPRGAASPRPVGTRTPRDWFFLGPFPNRGLHHPHAPEGRIDLEGQPETLQGPTRWKKRDGSEDSNSTISFNLKSVFGTNASANVTVYALNHVYSPRDQRVTLLIGSDDGFKVWVGGEEKGGRDVKRKLLPDEDKLLCDLKKGWNRILLKVTQGDGEFGMSFRIAGGADLLYDPYGDLPR